MVGNNENNDTQPIVHGSNDATGVKSLDPTIAPTPESAQDAGQWKAASIFGQSVNLVEVANHLVAPSEWVEEITTNPSLPSVTQFLERLSPLAVQTPWLITSGRKDLSGAERTDSKDHSEGIALDVAPMFQEDVILPEDPPMMGLAWNIKSLIILSEGQWGDVPVFVEGDHLHFSIRIKPDLEGCLPVMWSDSNAYPSCNAQGLDPILPRLRNSFWRWSTPNLTLEPPSKQLKEHIADLLSGQKQ